MGFVGTGLPDGPKNKPRRLADAFAPPLKGEALKCGELKSSQTVGDGVLFRPAKTHLPKTATVIANHRARWCGNPYPPKIGRTRGSAPTAGIRISPSRRGDLRVTRFSLIRHGLRRATFPKGKAIGGGVWSPRPTIKQQFSISAPRRGDSRIARYA